MDNILKGIVRNTTKKMVTGSYTARRDALWYMRVWQPKRTTALVLQLTALPQSLVSLLLEFARPPDPDPWPFCLGPAASPEYDAFGNYGSLSGIHEALFDDNTNIAHNF